MVYAGIELDTPSESFLALFFWCTNIIFYLYDLAGKHDGYLFGKRYFFAPQNCGMFLRLQDVVCVINKKVGSKMSYNYFQLK